MSSQRSSLTSSELKFLKTTSIYDPTKTRSLKSRDFGSLIHIQITGSKQMNQKGSLSSAKKAPITIISSGRYRSSLNSKQINPEPKRVYK